MLASGVQVVAGPEPEQVNRTTTCPFLVRVFPTTLRHREDVTYKSSRDLPKTEIQINTWLDCTLRELVDLLRQANPEATKGTVSFRRIYWVKATSRMASVHLGTVHTQKRGFEDSKTLKLLGFEIGDFLDVAVI